MRRVSSWLAATLSTILFLATPLLYAVTAGQGSGQQTLSDRKLTHYEDNGHDVLQTLNRAADRLRVPLGVELDGSLPKEPVSIEVSNGTIDDVFSAIVEHAPGYMWVEQDGVVNVIPKVNSANPILNLRINTFQIHNATPNEAAETIRSLPEVKAWLAQNHVTERSPVAPSMLAGGASQYMEIFRLNYMT